MGWNTTVVFHNDELHQLKTDPKIGEKIHTACLRAGTGYEYFSSSDLSFGCGQAIETHHADGYAVVAVGNNTGEVLGTVWPYGEGDLNVRILKAVADQMGFELHKKRVLSKRK